MLSSLCSKKKAPLGSLFMGSFVLLSALSLSSARRSEAYADGVITLPTITLDKAAFRAKLDEHMGFPGSKGNAALLMRNGQLVDEVGYGSAWMGPEGLDNYPFKTTTPTNIGSNMKMVSWVLLLEAFQNRKEKTVDQWLDTPMYAWLPVQWREFIATSSKVEHQNVKKVTFRMLMQHKSGFRSNPVKVAWNYLETGIKTADQGVRDYQNVNSTLVTYILPQLVDPAWAEHAAYIAKQNKIPNDDAVFYVSGYSKYFQAHMRNKFFNRVKPAAISPTCEAYADYVLKGIVPAYSFDTPIGNANPQLTGSKGKNEGCHSMGGWYFTTRELGMFFATAFSTETYLTNATKAKLYVDSTAATRDARLGWSQVLGSGFLTKHFKVNAVPYHGGDHVNYHSAVVQLPAGFVGILSTNYMTEGNSHSLAEYMKNAFAEGVRNSLE